MTWRCLALAFTLIVFGVNSDPSSTTTTTFTVKSMDSTTLNKKASKGDTTIEVFNTGDFDVGSELIIGFKNIIQETHKVKSRSVASGVGTLTLEQALENDHEAMTPVISVEPMPVLIPMPSPVPVVFSSTPAPTAAPTPVPAVETTMTTAVEAGATELSVADVTGFAAGDEITIGSAPTQETATIKSVLEVTSAGRRLATAGMLALDAALKYSHASDATVVKTSLPTTTLAADAAKGATELSFADVTGFAAGDEVEIAATKLITGVVTTEAEKATIKVIEQALPSTAGKVTLEAGLTHGHVKGTTVVKYAAPTPAPTAAPTAAPTTTAEMLSGSMSRRLGLGLAVIAAVLGCLALLCLLLACLCCGGKKQVRSTKVKKRPVPPVLPPAEPVPSVVEESAPLVDFGPSFGPPLVDFGLALPPLMPTAAPMMTTQSIAVAAPPMMSYVAPAAPTTTSIAAPIIDMKYMGGAAVPAAPTLGYGTSSGYEVVSQVF